MEKKSVLNEYFDMMMEARYLKNQLDSLTIESARKEKEFFEYKRLHGIMDQYDFNGF